MIPGVVVKVTDGQNCISWRYGANIKQYQMELGMPLVLSTPHAKKVWDLWGLVN